MNKREFKDVKEAQSYHYSKRNRLVFSLVEELNYNDKINENLLW